MVGSWCHGLAVVGVVEKESFLFGSMRRVLVDSQFTEKGYWALSTMQKTNKKLGKFILLRF